MTRRLNPTPGQDADLQKVLTILEERIGKNVNKTLTILETAGYTPAWRRVVWTGGVGSYKWMPRRRKIRILVAATKSGFSAANTIPVEYGPGIVGFVHKDAKRRGFRYGWCVEC